MSHSLKRQKNAKENKKMKGIRIQVNLEDFPNSGCMLFPIRKNAPDPPNDHNYRTYIYTTQREIQNRSLNDLPLGKPNVPRKGTPAILQVAPYSVPSGEPVGYPTQHS